MFDNIGSQAGILITAVELAAGIEAGYREALSADRCYSGLITKNPIHPHWHTLFPANEDYGYYDLEYLSEFVELPKMMH